MTDKGKTEKADYTDFAALRLSPRRRTIALFWRFGYVSIHLIRTTQRHLAGIGLLRHLGLVPPVLVSAQPFRHACGTNFGAAHCVVRRVCVGAAAGVFAGQGVGCRVQAAQSAGDVCAVVAADCGKLADLSLGDCAPSCGGSELGLLYQPAV